MNRDDCIGCGIDYDEGVARFMGRTDLYEEFLSDFTFSALEAALQAEDRPAAFAAAHTLKGVAGNLSLRAFYRSLLPLAEALREQGNLPLAKSLFPSAQSEYRRAVECIAAQTE